MNDTPERESMAPGERGWTRRRFVQTGGAAALGVGGGVAGLLGPACSLRGPTAIQLARRRETPPHAGPPRKVALLISEVRRMSHGQHFLDRFLEGYGWNGEHHHPPFEVAGLYVDQFPENDLARERSRRFGIPLASTIEEALTGGGSRLAVDGVVIVAEHGKYPDNEKGQRLYPRYPFFKRVVKVFEASGRSVPVFNDKHLSTDWDQCVEMVADSRRLGFPFLAGSSLPVTWRIPDMEVPIDTPLTESLCACYGGVDSYDFHGLETAQCVSERRRGGEVGIRSVQALKGARVWSLLREREIPRRLLFAALARSQTCRVPEGFTCLPPDLGWLESLCPEVIAYLIEHRDGFRTTMLLLNGLIQDFNYAGFEPRRNRIHSCQMYLPMPSSRSTLADFFNPLVNNIEIMLRTGKAPYPVERTLLTSGMTLGGVESLHRGQVPFETPGMEVLYRAPAESHHWRS